MTSTAKQPLTTAGNIFVFLFALFAIVGFIDYAFYGQQLRNLLSGLGFSLLVYGALKNGFSATEPQHVPGSYATILGSLLLVAAIALRFL
ncbi:hypothetical protein [Luteimonas terrae]|uniref:Uncharacterized protein n=1 Tax=Luteimonas terrae TaxID=1530191 RepID=A0ABU1XV37_9GAMM|nr:hypothetical protein [Luteimonas terrae]MDR7192095.1 hypothetical protein [Luteimonas terrae]